MSFGEDFKLLLVHALAHSRLDCCNSFLACLPWSHVQQLQSVLDSDARFIFGMRWFDHITLMDLHWASLPKVHYLQTLHDYI